MEETLDKVSTELELPMISSLDKKSIREVGEEISRLSIDIVTSWPPRSTKNGSPKFEVGHERNSFE